jgi:hypothetical protein
VPPARAALGRRTRFFSLGGVSEGGVNVVVTAGSPNYWRAAGAR